MISSRREELRVMANHKKIIFCLKISKGLINGADSMENNS